jgi:hypothetical protein
MSSMANVQGVRLAWIAPLLLLLVLLPAARASDGKPPGACTSYYDAADYVVNGVQKGFQLIKTAGSEAGCKPMIDASVHIAQVGSMGSQVQADITLQDIRLDWTYRLHDFSGGRLRAVVDSIPYCAEILVASDGCNAGIPIWDVQVADQTLAGGGVVCDVLHQTVHGKVPYQSSDRGGCGFVLTSSGLWVQATIIAADPEHYDSRWAQAVVDPWVTIDPEWEYADSFAVEIETAPGSDVWVPPSRDWMNSWSDVSNSSMLTTGGIPTWVDYDNDGDLDLHVLTSGTDRLYQNDGNGGFVDVASGPIADTGPGRGCAWGDYDNDGDLDVYIAKMEPQPNTLLRNDGNGVLGGLRPGRRSRPIPCELRDVEQALQE